ncbi:MAG: DUF2513 domain-containing protein [Clostridium sp.]|mgnify:CR=1 FL=1|nr:DUF2513 domain-containing protein [Clostridium sp.]
MKQDYNLMKSILETMEDCEKPYIESYELAEKLGLLNRNTMQVLDDSKLNDFIGHIYLLGDNRCIDSTAKNYGWQYNIHSCDYMGTNASYRMTAQGYEFLEMLRKKNIFEKIKGLTVPVALEVGKSLLISKLTGQ